MTTGRYRYQTSPTPADDPHDFQPPTAYVHSALLSSEHGDLSGNAYDAAAHKPFKGTEQFAYERSPRRTMQQTLHRVLSWGWTWEILSFGVAFASLAGIFALLAVQNERSLPHWPSQISVNTLLSVLVTIMKAAMVIPIAEGLSQLKWSWFRKDRPLQDIVAFDEASRGTYGVSKLFFSFQFG
jgi:hypothetical protein